jgi:serine/threonine protein kinase
MRIDTLEKDKGSRLQLAIPGHDSVVFECESPSAQFRWILAFRRCTYTHPHLSMANFTIISVIGRRFYGKVILCEHRDTGERVAIKLIHKARLVESDRVYMVVPELVPQHVHCCAAIRVPDAVEVLPRARVRAWRRVLLPGKATRPLPPGDLRVYMAEICLALDYVHNIGILYRDLTLENILLDEASHVKLTDFGLAKDLGAPNQKTSTLCRTSEYLAPQVVQRLPYGVEAD